MSLELLGKTYKLRCLKHSVFDLRLRNTCNLQRISNVLIDSHGIKQIEVLKYHSDPVAFLKKLLLGKLKNIRASEFYRTAVGCLKSVNAPGQSGFAGTRESYDPEYLTFIHFQIDSFKNLQRFTMRIESLMQISDLQISFHFINHG